MRLVAFATLAALLFLAAPVASAHKTAYSSDGKIKIVWGFLNEPAVTMTKTGLDLILTDNLTGAPIDGVTANTLKAEMHFGDDEHAFTDFGPQFGQHGRYTGVITLTKPGIYTLHLTGTINGTDLGADGMEIPGAHEVEDYYATTFPHVNATDPAAMQVELDAMKSRLDALEAKVKTQSSTPASVTTQAPSVTGSAPAPALGLVAAAIAVVGVALVLRRKSG